MTSTDSSPRAAARHLELYQKLGIAGRALIAAELSDAVRETAIAGIRRRHPDYTDRDVARAFLEAVYGVRIER